MKQMSTIKIYTTPTCPWCAKTKEWLKEHRISFKNINVMKDVKAQQEMITKSGQMGVPVLDINGKIIVGFDPEEIQAALAVTTMKRKIVTKKKKKKASSRKKRR